MTLHIYHSLYTSSGLSLPLGKRFVGKTLSLKIIFSLIFSFRLIYARSFEISFKFRGPLPLRRAILSASSSTYCTASSPGSPSFSFTANFFVKTVIGVNLHAKYIGSPRFHEQTRRLFQGDPRRHPAPGHERNGQGAPMSRQVPAAPLLFFLHCIGGCPAYTGEPIQRRSCGSICSSRYSLTSKPLSKTSRFDISKFLDINSPFDQRPFYHIPYFLCIPRRAEHNECNSHTSKPSNHRAKYTAHNPIEFDF